MRMPRSRILRALDSLFVVLKMALLLLGDVLSIARDSYNAAKGFALRRTVDFPPILLLQLTICRWTRTET
jgi:hypothetical protein